MRLVLDASTGVETAKRRLLAICGPIKPDPHKVTGRTKQRPWRALQRDARLERLRDGKRRQDEDCGDFEP